MAEESGHTIYREWADLLWTSLDTQDAKDDIDRKADMADLLRGKDGLRHYANIERQESLTAGRLDEKTGDIIPGRRPGFPRVFQFKDTFSIPMSKEQAQSFKDYIKALQDSKEGDKQLTALDAPTVRDVRNFLDSVINGTHVDLGGNGQGGESDDS